MGTKMALSDAHKSADQSLKMGFVKELLEGFPALKNDGSIRSHTTDKTIDIGQDTGHKVTVGLSHFPGNRPSLKIEYTINREKDPSMNDVMGDMSSVIDEEVISISGIEFAAGYITFDSIKFFGSFLHSHRGAAKAVLERIGRAIKTGEKLTTDDVCFHTTFSFGPPPGARPALGR